MIIVNDHSLYIRPKNIRRPCIINAYFSKVERELLLDRPFRNFLSSSSFSYYKKKKKKKKKKKWEAFFRFTFHSIDRSILAIILFR